MNRKIIFKAKDFDNEICSFLTQVGADIPINWSSNALALVRDAVIEPYNKMGTTLKVDKRLHEMSLTALPTSDRGGTVS
jgi:hypothetical protein